jgi:DNA-binding Lrp family transcriptional regulator
MEEEPRMAEAYETDEKDRELMERLVDNARVPVEVLAGELELSLAEVEQRIARLEQIGIIKAYRAVVDPYLYSLYFYENGPLGLGATAGSRTPKGARAPRR